MVIVVSGGIGSGKSFVCSVLEKAGFSVYDCDSAAKRLYRTHAELSSMLCPDIFDRPGRLKALEGALFPVLMEDFRKWARGRDAVAVESATILDKDYFRGFGDYILWVDAPAGVRIERAVGRGTIDRTSIEKRMALQPSHKDDPLVNRVIDTSGSKDDTRRQVYEFLKDIDYGKS